MIAGYTPGKGGRSPAFGALILGLYENMSGDRFPPASAERSPGTGSEREEACIYRQCRFRFLGPGSFTISWTRSHHLKTGTPQFAVPGQKGTVVWLEPVLVAEVAYQEVTRDRKLRIPRFIRLRSDKQAEECTMDQLEPCEG